MEELKREGARYFEKGQYAEAVNIFNQAVARYPHDGKSHYFLACARWQLADENRIPQDERPQEYVQVADGFREAKRRGEDSDDLYHFMAISVQLKCVRHWEREHKEINHSDSFHESNLYLEVLARRNSELRIVYHFRGRNHYRLKNYKEAERDLAKALEIKGQEEMYLPLILRYLARTKLELKKYREAIELAEKSYELRNYLASKSVAFGNSTCEASWRTRAEAHFFLKEYEEACRFLDLFLAKRKNKMSMWILRAKIHFVLKKYDLAIADCEGGIYENGQSDEAIMILDAARKCKQLSSQGPVGMPRGEVPEPLQVPPPPFNPAWSAAQGGYAGAPLVDTVFSQPNPNGERPSAPSLEGGEQNEKVLKRQGSCRIL